MSKLVTPSKFPEALSKKSEILSDILPGADPEKLSDYLANLSPERQFHWGNAGFASLFFDIAFSPGIIPKSSEKDYKAAYQRYFQEQYRRPMFTEDDLFIFQNEAEFYDDPNLGPSSPTFVHDWVANLRAVALMSEHFRKPQAKTIAEIRVNLVEAALCHIVELGLPYPEDLFESLPIQDQVRLNDVIRAYHGQELFVGELFLICNQVEFEKSKFARETGARTEIVKGAQAAVRGHIQRTTLSGTLTFEQMQKQAARDELVKNTLVTIGKPNYHKITSAQRYHFGFPTSLKTTEDSQQLINEALLLQGSNLPSVARQVI